MSSLCLLTPSHPSLQDSQHISHTPVGIQTDILEVQIGHTHSRSHIHTGADYSKSWWGMEGVRMKVKETGGHGCRPSVASRRQHSHTNKMKVGATLLSKPQHTALCINMHHQRESRQVLTYHFMVPKAKQRKILLLKTDTTCSKSDTLRPRLVVEHGNTLNLGLTDSKNILSLMCFPSPDVY